MPPRACGSLRRLWCTTRLAPLVTRSRRASSPAMARPPTLRPGRTADAPTDVTMLRPSQFARPLGAYAAPALPVLGPLACGGGDGPTEPPRPTISKAAKDYLNAALDSTEWVFYYGSRVNWATLRQTALARAAEAQTFAETYPAIEQAIASLGDP